MSKDQFAELPSPRANAEQRQEPLINRVYGEGEKLGHSQLSSNANFRPTSGDIQDLINTENLFFGLTKANLSQMAKEAMDKDDLRKEGLFKFLGNHFNDVARLANDDTQQRITKADLNLYADVLKNNESSAEGSKISTRKLEDLHSEHHSRGFPVAGLSGFGTGGYLAHKSASFAFGLPGVEKTLLNSMTPGRAAALGVGYLAGVLGAGYLGSRAGEHFSTGYNSQSIRTHFYDEAQPAMRRLLK